jgi:hypothetical protein
MVAAENQIKALSPFALVKATSLYLYQDGPVFQNFKVFNNDPSDPASYFEQSNEPQQSIHFYPNSMAVENATFPANSTPYTDIFVKPVFKVKKMIFENLGTQVIPKNLTVITDNPNVNDLPIQYSYASNDVVNVPQFNTLTTISKDKDYLYILITNRNAKKGEDTTPFKVSVDNVPIPSAEIMYLDGKAYNDKQPDYTNAVAGTSANLFNRTQPTYKPVNSVNGIFDIPNLSICILKVALTPLPPLACEKVSPTSTPSSCDAISVSWNPAQNQILSNPSFTNVNIVSQSVYYYELLDAPNNPVITTFDPNDPNWRLYADNLPPDCNKILLTGLKYPQDEYPIAVVTRYQFNAGPTVIGLNSRLSACLGKGKTSHCENRIDVSKINTATLGTASNPNVNILNQLITYSDVAFCGDQLVAPSAINFYGITDFEFDVSNSHIDAIKLYGGADNGVFEIYYDTDLNVAGYSNINPLWATTSAFGTTIIPIVCGVDNVKRIKIRKLTAGDNLRRFVLYGVPMTPTANEPMPKCCGSNTKKMITQSTVSAAITAGKLLPMNPNPNSPAVVGIYADNTPQEVFITSPTFDFNQNYMFFKSDVYLGSDVLLDLSSNASNHRNLQLVNSKLQGCDFMWKGINVGNNESVNLQNSSVSDAENAINVQMLPIQTTTMASRPKVVVEDSKFIRNYKAIDINGVNRSNSHSRLAAGSTFKNIVIDGSTSNLKPKTGLNVPRRAEIGVAGNLLNTISVGHNTGDVNKTSIQVNNVRRPYEFSNSNLINLLGIGVDNRKFLTNAGDWLSYVAISDVSNLGFNVTNYENSLSQRILGCTKGLSSYNSTASNLKNTHFEDVDIAAYYWNTQFINCDNNKMWINSVGVLANSPKSYFVTKNNIAHKNLPQNGVVFISNPIKYGGIGVGINYVAETSNASGTIEDNDIFVKTNPILDQAVCVGVLLNKAVNATIRRNDIKLQNDMPTFDIESRFYGVYKSGGYDNTVCGNDITGLYGYDRGIGSAMSPGNITCNLIQYTRSSLFFTGDNRKPNSISGNEFSNTYAGIHVNSLTNFQMKLGEQSHQGNKWVNNWRFGGLWEGNDITTVSQSKFLNNIQYPFIIGLMKIKLLINLQVVLMM